MWPTCREKAAGTDEQGLLAMQKVVGSSPISRLESPANRHCSVVRAVWLGRRRSRVRSPSADLGKAPANSGVPAASSRRFVRADEVSRAGRQLGDRTHGPNDRRSARGRGRAGSTLSADGVAPTLTHLRRSRTPTWFACARRAGRPVWPSARTCPSCQGAVWPVGSLARSPRTCSNTGTIEGSNWVPAHRRSSASASSIVLAGA